MKKKKRELIKRMVQLSVHGTPEQLAAALRSGVSPNLYTKNDESLLTYAICWERADNVRVLIAARVDIEQRRSGWSPLMYAAAEGDIEIVRMLLQAGADARRRDRHGSDAAVIAEGRGKAECAALLRGSAGA